MCVTATGVSTGSVVTATTGAGGAYTLVGVTPDNFTVYFDPSCAGTVSSPDAWQYYNGVTPEASATAVSVASGASVANINASLTMGSTIEGSVAGTGGTAAGGVCVEFYLSINSVDSAFIGKTVSANTGAYQLGSFPDGGYLVRFDPTCATSQSSPYAVQDYSGQPDPSTANLIDITSPDSTASGINAALVPGASISGTVTVPGATSSANVCVDAYAGPGYLQSVTTTNAAGTFDIMNLPGDTYKLKVDPSCLATQTSDFAVNWYSDAASIAAATSFSLSSGGSLTGITTSVALGVPAVAIATTSLPGGSTTSAYSATVQAAGGTGPYTWAASGLPAGLSINAATGVFSGTPTAGGTFNVTVTATDAAAQPVSATGSYSLSISQPVVVTTTTVAPQIQTVCSDKTKTETIRRTEVKNGKKIIVVTHKKIRLYKTVTIRKIEKIKGKKVWVITHKTEVIKVCKTVIVS